MSVIVKRNAILPGVFHGIWDSDLFNNFLDNGSSSMPAVNIVEKEKEFAVDMSVPGFDKGDINVQVENDTLTISARHENKNEEKDANNKVIRQEFSSSSFERSFILPENIDTENIAAKQENGILKISLPKQIDAPEDKTKKISVQ